MQLVGAGTQKQKTHSHNLEVGHKVGYVPHVDHALTKNAAGDRPWKVGKRVRTGRMIPNPDNPNDIGTLEFNVVFPEVREMDDYLDYIKRLPPNAAAEEKKNLIFAEPTHVWDAVVTAVNDDGTVDLDSACHNGGVTLHVRNVEVHPNKKQPHTCHRKEG